MSATQPSRRTLVKGAAWSVPLVAVGSQAPAVAASPCNIIVTADCTASGLSFSYSVTGPRPETLSFTLTVSGQGPGGEGQWTPGPGVNFSGDTATVISETATSGVLLNVARNAGVGARVYTVTFRGTTECTVSSASGQIDRGNCTEPASINGARTLTSDEAAEAPAPADSEQKHGDAGIESADAGTGSATGEPLGQTQSVTDGQIQSGTDEEATTAGP